MMCSTLQHVDRELDAPTGSSGRCARRRWRRCGARTARPAAGRRSRWPARGCRSSRSTGNLRRLLLAEQAAEEARIAPLHRRPRRGCAREVVDGDHGGRVYSSPACNRRGKRGRAVGFHRDHRHLRQAVAMQALDHAAQQAAAAHRHHDRVEHRLAAGLAVDDAWQNVSGSQPKAGVHDGAGHAVGDVVFEPPVGVVADARQHRARRYQAARSSRSKPNSRQTAIIAGVVSPARRSGRRRAWPSAT